LIERHGIMVEAKLYYPTAFVNPSINRWLVI
jgi:hypothetical protein